MRCPPPLAIALLACLPAWPARAAANRSSERSWEHRAVLIEAEAFETLGGWSVDQQAMDQMGSPYLLAHGLGVPVEDATTRVEIPAGTYRVWVRTRDWVAPWKAPGAPGRFQLLIDGQPLAALFGTEGAEWHWQDGGTLTCEATRTVAVTLHDLTGFDGRCDAIVFSADLRSPPPNEPPSLAEFRRRALGLPDVPQDGGQFDLVVCGGGIAGTCAAIAAARLGIRVALIHDRPVLGGNNSSEVRVGLSGKIHQPPYPALGNVVQEIAPLGYYDFVEARKNPDLPWSQRILALDPVKAEHNAGPASNYEDEKKLHAVRAEKNIDLRLNMRVVRAEKEGDRIAAVIARDTRSSREMRFRGRLFADCTGDGNVGYLVGADYRVGREARSETGESLAPERPDLLTMGTSVQWYAVQGPPSPFPECPWAVPFTEETCQRLTKGDWDWETGMNRDQIAEVERIRDHALRVVFGNWSFLKNHSREREKYAPWRLAWVAYVGGKRESRRLLGDVILTQQDIQGRREFPDASVTTTWSIDLHYPSPANTRHFPGEEFRSIAKTVPIQPYAIPYRCLYSRNVTNLFMAGRDISVTHVALGTVRVQKTTGMMGEVVGMAAALCTRHGTTPRGVYEKHLHQLKQHMKAGIPQRDERTSGLPP